MIQGAVIIEHMFPNTAESEETGRDGLAGIEAAVREYAMSVEPETFAGDDAARQVKRCSDIDHMVVALKARFAKRAFECRVFEKEGERSHADWLARTTGDSLGAARQLIDAQEKLSELEAVDEAFRNGELSLGQLAAVTDAAEGDPSSQAELLDAARRESLRGLRDTCLKHKAQRRSEEEQQAAFDKMRAGRYFRHFTDAEGAFCFSGRSTPDDGARLMGLLDQETKKHLDAARREGRREPPEAYRLDALLSLAGGSGSGQREVVVCKVDGAGLFSFDHEAETTCEVSGFGPVPLQTAKDLLGDAILDIVIAEGKDIRTVVSNTRHRPRPVEVAVRARDEVCAKPGCDSRLGLQFHHIETFVPNYRTAYDCLARVCGRHHHEITNQGALLTGTAEAWEWIPAERQRRGPVPAGAGQATRRDRSARAASARGEPSRRGPRRAEPSWSCDARRRPRPLARTTAPVLILPQRFGDPDRM